MSNDGEGTAGAVIHFLPSHARRRKPGERAIELGYSSLCRIIGVPTHQTTGHFCSRCDGIWYGYLLEVTCPVCGNRHG